MEAITENVTSVAIVGLGHMGDAMAKRLEQTEAYAVTEVRRDDDRIVLECQDIAILAMRPQQWSVIDEHGDKHVARQVGEHVNRQGILVSIMAGITVRRLCEDIGTTEVGTVRAMLTAAVDGHSLTALYAEESVLTTEQKAQVEALFAQFGEYFWLNDEDLFADFTAIVGSGVGFFAEFTETVRRIATEKRFDKGQADKMARAALSGAAHLITAEHSAAEVVKEIETPNGTTAAGLRVLRYRGYHRMMRAVVNAAAKRSRQLAKS